MSEQPLEMRSAAVTYPLAGTAAGVVAPEREGAVAAPLREALFVLTGVPRLVAWLAVLALTAALLLFPVQHELAYGQAQSLAVVGDIRLFAPLYCSWLAVLLALLLSRAGPVVNHGEKAVLVGLFALVFWGFWVLAAPEGQAEEPAFLAYARFLERTGHISLDSQNLSYFDFPGLGLLAYAVPNVTGLSHLGARTAILLLNAVLMAVLVYVGSRHLVGRQAGWLFLLCVPVLIQGSMFLSVSFFFRPEAALALPLFLALLILVLREGGSGTFFGSWQSSLLGIALFSTLMITHFMTALAFIAVLVGLWVVRALAGVRTVSASSTLILFAVATVAWQVYYAVRTFGGIVESVPYFVGLIEEGSIFFYARTLGSANAGAAVPLWESSVRLFWLAALFVLGALLALINLTRLRRLTGGERDCTGAVLGIGGMTAIAALINGTGDQAARFLEYGSFFVVPLVILFLARRTWRQIVPGLVLLSFLALSLPSFLTFHGQAAQDSFKVEEKSAALFLADTYAGEEEGLLLYSSPRERLFHTYYLQEATFESSPFAVSSRNDVPVFWQGMGDLMDSFSESGGSPTQRSVFVFARPFVLTYEHLLALSPEDPHWLDVKGRLAETNAFYDNGLVQMFQPSR